MKRLFLVLLLVVFAAACASEPPGPWRGRVIVKSYDDPDSGQNPIYCYINGYIQICGWIPWYESAHWYLTTDNGQTSGRREVTEEVYNKCEISQWCNARTGERIYR